MQIHVVIDNISHCALGAEHGLCLFVQTEEHRFFFDFGQTDLFLSNAQAMGIDVESADFAIVSHGHYDHGGGIEAFLHANAHAPVFLHPEAFARCYSEKEGRKRYIGLAPALQGHPRLHFVTDSPSQGFHPHTEAHAPAKNIEIFSLAHRTHPLSPANGRLFVKLGDTFLPDDFRHEQSVVISEGDRRVLLAGCAHGGILNIMERAEQLIGASLTDVVGGLHLKGVADERYITQLATALAARPCHYHTCHCTGEEAYEQLRQLLGPQISYASAGSVIRL
ncbi:MAG: MBL fold metallo-hydrolase [Bacteroidaceae bacterium]|nr:MBL fold metallo-hydrolase [Bacteroidaceae bacterium]